MELFAAVKTLVFASAVDTLFGPHFALGDGASDGSKALETSFFEFEAGFEVRRVKPSWEIGTPVALFKRLSVFLQTVCGCNPSIQSAALPAAAALSSLSVSCRIINALTVSFVLHLTDLACLQVTTGP